jgi:hypothetical protein
MSRPTTRRAGPAAISIPPLAHPDNGQHRQHWPFRPDLPFPHEAVSLDWPLAVYLMVRSHEARGLDVPRAFIQTARDMDLVVSDVSMMYVPLASEVRRLADWASRRSCSGIARVMPPREYGEVA